MSEPNKQQKKKKKQRNRNTVQLPQASKSLIHLHKQLKEAGALEDVRLKQFNRIGNSEIEWEENFIKQLFRPTVLFYAIMELWCSFKNIPFDEVQNELKTGIPLIIRHRVSLIVSTWQANMKQYVIQLLKSIGYQNQKIITEAIENWELFPKDMIIQEFFKILKEAKITAYIHKGYFFPTIDPEIIKNGEVLVTHLIENEGYYWPVSIFKGSRYSLTNFYELSLEKRNRLILTKVDWAIALKNDLIGIQLLEELTKKKRIVLEPVNNEYEEIFGKLQQITNERQRSLELEGYDNFHLGLDSISKIISLTLLSEKKINLIIVNPSTVKNLGEIWSFFYLEDILTVQIVTDNSAEQKIIQKSYEAVQNQITNAHLVLCQKCKDKLVPKEILQKHQESCFFDILEFVQKQF